MIEGVVFTALRSLVNDRCYPLTFLQPPDGTLPTWPAIRYTVISSDSLSDICGTEEADTDDAIVQIDVVAKTHGAMLSLRDDVIAAMMEIIPIVTRQNEFQTYDEITKTYRVTLDYLFSGSTTSVPD